MQITIKNSKLKETISDGTLTFGADPEVGAYYEKDDTMYVQPAPYFRRELGLDVQKPNSKHPIIYDKYGLRIIEDGVAFEFTVPGHRSTKKLFQDIQNCRESLHDILSKMDHGFTIRPTLNYEIERFLTADSAYKMALMFGCDPDNDAILPDYICNVIDALQHPYRYFGGHFHIGCNNAIGKRLIQTHYVPFIKLLAIFVGNTVISKTSYPKLEQQRSKMYGQPGRYRLQPWGIEYRTPSNNWINSEYTLLRMAQAAKMAFTLLQNPKYGKQVIEVHLEPAIDAIVRADQEKAKQNLENLGCEYDF